MRGCSLEKGQYWLQAPSISGKMDEEIESRLEGVMKPEDKVRLCKELNKHKQIKNYILEGV